MKKKRNFEKAIVILYSAGPLLKKDDNLESCLSESKLMIKTRNRFCIFVKYHNSYFFGNLLMLHSTASRDTLFKFLLCFTQPANTCSNLRIEDYRKNKN